MRYLCEIPIGEIIEVGSHTFTEESIVAYAKEYDRQPYHMDPEAAKDHFFGGIIASGWQTGSIFMRLLVKWFHDEDQKRRDAGLPLAQRSASPGMNGIKWPRPVRAGDTVTYRGEVTAKRKLKSRPGWGIMTVITTANNQHGEDVFEFTGYTIMEWGDDD